MSAPSIVGGWSLLHDPVPWRGSDNGTSGPLNMYVLTAAFWLGLPVKLMTARIVMVVLAADPDRVHLRDPAQARRPTGGGAAGFGPGVVRLSGRMRTTSITIRNRCRWRFWPGPCCSMCWPGPAGGPADTGVWGGVAAGGNSVCEIAGGSFGLFLALVFAIDLWRSRRAGSGWWRRLLALGLGGVSVPLLMTVVLLATGTWHDFVTSYFGFARSYGVPLGCALGSRRATPSTGRTCPGFCCMRSWS